MYNGNNEKKRRLRWSKQVLLLCSVAVLVFGVTGSTLAYLITNTEDVVNTFTSPEIGIDITEDFEDGQNEKKDVKVTNKCDFPVRVRATYVAYFAKTEAGKTIIESTVPDLKVELGAGWSIKDDGYYLYDSIVAAESTTGNFINSAKLNEGATVPDGYELVVDVIAEVVQAEPAQAMKDVWGYE